MFLWSKWGLLNGHQRIHRSLKIWRQITSVSSIRWFAIDGQVLWHNGHNKRFVQERRNQVQDWCNTKGSSCQCHDCNSLIFTNKRKARDAIWGRKDRRSEDHISTTSFDWRSEWEFSPYTSTNLWSPCLSGARPSEGIREEKKLNEKRWKPTLMLRKP